MTNSRKANGRILSALVIACAMAVTSAQTASAQTASNLKCKKCVDTKDIAKKAVTKSRIKNDAVTFSKLNPKVEGGIKQDRTFYETLQGSGARVTLVTQGPLSMFARCFINDAGNDRLEIVYTSTEPDWLETLTGGAVVRFANEEVIITNPSVATGTSAAIPLGLVGDALAPDGSFISPEFFITVGFNVFGKDCLVAGSATAITGNL